MKKYSILTFNFNNYEIMREPEEIDSECEYIYVTDNKELKSDKWQIIYDESLDGLSPFDKSFKVRYNPFNYVSTDVCIIIDSSMQIHKSLKKFYNDFINSGADIALNIHPERDNIYDEYVTWIHYKKYPIEQANKGLQLCKLANYNPKTKGLYQSGLRIVKNTERTKELNNFVYYSLLIVSEPNKIDRLDQTIFSFIFNSRFGDMKVFPFSQQVFQSDYINYCFHNSTKPVPYNKYNDKQQGYCQEKLINLYRI